MKCCGQDVATPFCPHCGAKIDAGPFGNLLGLVKHCRRQESTLLKTIEKMKQSPSFRYHTAEQNKTWEKRVGRYELRCSKWGEWATALEELLAVARSADTTPNEGGQ